MSGELVSRLRAAGTCLAVASGLMVAVTAPTAQAAPSFQLPFECGQQWRLDTWGHNPALDMVREPDQVGTEGAAVVAPAAGTVNQSFYHDNAGNVIQINHGGGHFTTYLHLQSRAVPAGATVAQGQLIGRVGKTGPTSNGHPHLHYEQGFDGNGDGSVTWGFDGAERVPAMFNGVTYTGSSSTWRNVTSRNCAESGDVRHRVRNPDGSWSPFGGLSLRASQVAVAADPNGRTHVLAVSGGQLSHRLRAADGSWTPWGPLGNPGTATSVGASTDAGGNLQVMFVADGAVYHRIRHVGDGSWTPAGLLGAPTGTTTTSVSVTVDPARNLAHATVTAGGQLHHRIRNADGSWTPWGPLGNPGTATSVSTGIDAAGDLHVALVSNGTIYHRVRNAEDGSWTATNPLGAPTGTTATAISSAGDPTQYLIHVSTVANGQLYHRIRNTDGTWTPWGPLDNTGTFTAVSASVDPTHTLQLAAIY